MDQITSEQSYTIPPLKPPTPTEQQKSRDAELTPQDQLTQTEQLQSGNPLTSQPKKSFAKTFLVILCLVCFLAVIGFFLVANRSHPTVSSQMKIAISPVSTIIPTKQAQLTMTSGEYTNPIGLSFVNPTTLKITDYDYSKMCDILATPYDEIYNQPYGASKPPTTASSSATDISIGDTYSLSSIRIDVLRTNAIGSRNSNEGCGPGDLNAFRLFDRTDTLYSDVEELITKKINPAQSHNFNDNGMADRFNVTAYENTTSHVFGFSNDKLYGFQVPGLTLSKEYFLYDPSKRYVLYVNYNIICQNQQEFEKSQDIASSDTAHFNPDNYTKGMHDLAQGCDDVSSGKKTVEKILSSMKFTN